MKFLGWIILTAWRAACLGAVLLGVAVVWGLISLSSPQHSTDTNLHLAQTCPSGTAHESATIGTDGKVDSVGEGKVAFDLAPNSHLQSAGVNLTAEDGYVVKAASISADSAGAQQVQAEEGTSVTSVRVGQFSRNTSVVRADACVGQSNWRDKLAGFAHVLGKFVAGCIAVFMLLVGGAGYMVGKFFGRKSGRKESANKTTGDNTVSAAPLAP